MLGRRTRTYLPWVACAMAAVVAVPALAFGPVRPPSTADRRRPTPAFVAELASRSPPAARSHFSYPSGNARHNVYFDRARSPRRAAQTAGRHLDAEPAAAVVHAGPGLGRHVHVRRPRDVSVPLPGQLRADRARSSWSRRPRRRRPRRRRRRRPPRPHRADRVAGRDPRQGQQLAARATGSRTRRRADAADNSVTVGPGGSVTFSYPAGASIHNVVFDATPAGVVHADRRGQPGAGPPLPPVPRSRRAGPGYCTFAALGTYTFVCSVHPEMTGSVVVEENAPVPTPTPTPRPRRRRRPRRPRTPTPTADADRRRCERGRRGAGARRHAGGGPAHLGAARPPGSGLSIDGAAARQLRLTARCVSAGSGRSR